MCVYEFKNKVPSQVKQFVGDVPEHVLQELSQFSHVGGEIELEYWFVLQFPTHSLSDGYKYDGEVQDKQFKFVVPSQVVQEESQS